MSFFYCKQQKQSCQDDPLRQRSTSPVLFDKHSFLAYVGSSLIGSCGSFLVDEKYTGNGT